MSDAVISEVTGAVISHITDAVISQVTGAVTSQVAGNVSYLMLYHFPRYSSKSTSSICSSLTLRRHKNDTDPVVISQSIQG